MINFRFHVVSLIAIFLALALGVVIGAGVIDRGVVDALNTRLDTVESRSETIKSENSELRDRNQQIEGIVGDMQPFAVAGQLRNDSFGIVAVRGVSGDRVSSLVTAAQQADATVTGTLWLEDKWELKDGASVKALQQVLGTTTKNKNSLRIEGYQQVAQRLADPDLLAGGDQDLLVLLQQAGFVGYDAVDNSTLASFPGRDAGITLVVGNSASLQPDLVAAQAASALHSADVPLVVASMWTDVTDGPARGDAVQPIRDSQLATTVSTVDDVDLVEGPTTVVIAMADLFLTPPVVGHYGYGSGPNVTPFPDPVTQ